MVRDEPLLGTGAGSFEAHWFRERSVAFHARDAHNLYLETLAELGPVGLALLLATLALPLLALPGSAPVSPTHLPRQPPTPPFSCMPASTGTGSCRP